MLVDGLAGGRRGHIDGGALPVRHDRDGLGGHDGELGVLPVGQRRVQVRGDLSALRVDAQIRECLCDRVAGRRLLRRDAVQRQVDVLGGVDDDVHPARLLGADP